MNPLATMSWRAASAKADELMRQARRDRQAERARAGREVDGAPGVRLPTLAVPVLLALLGLALLVAALAPFVVPADAGARTRTIHPCPLGDEPCTPPAPTPKPR
jgi:hypothetical protein